MESAFPTALFQRADDSNYPLTPVMFGWQLREQAKRWLFSRLRQNRPSRQLTPAKPTLPNVARDDVRAPVSWLDVRSRWQVERERERR